MEIFNVPDCSELLRALDNNSEQWPNEDDDILLREYNDLVKELDKWRECDSTKYLDFVTITHNRRGTSVDNQYDFLCLHTHRALKKNFIMIYEFHSDETTLHLHGLMERVNLKDRATLKMKLCRELYSDPRNIKIEPVKNIDNVIKYMLKHQIGMYEAGLSGFTNVNSWAN